MKLRTGVIRGVLLACMPALAFALDPSAAGRYALVHVDGHLTDSQFRLVNAAAHWSLESRRDDGRWENVTCMQACELLDSSAADRERILGGTLLQGRPADCIHDKAFAICMVSGKPYMVGLVTGRPILMNIVRVD